jgi:hypothetical protein
LCRRAGQPRRRGGCGGRGGGRRRGRGAWCGLSPLTRQRGTVRRNPSRSESGGACSESDPGPVPAQSSSNASGGGRGPRAAAGPETPPCGRPGDAGSARCGSCSGPGRARTCTRVPLEPVRAAAQTALAGCQVTGALRVDSAPASSFLQQLFAFSSDPFPNLLGVSKWKYGFSITELISCPLV